MSQLFNVDPRILTESDRKIINYFKKNGHIPALLSINEIGAAIGISNSTLTRFSKKMGFKNFKELKMALLSQQETSPSTKLQNAIRSDHQLNGPESMIQRDIDQLLETMEYLDPTLLRLAAQNLARKRRIYIFSKGATRSLGDLLHFRLRRFGRDVQHICVGGSEIFETLHMMTTDDLIIVFAFGKVPKETRVILDFANKEGITTLYFTDQLYQKPETNGNIPFYVARGLPTEYHSLTSAISLIEALIVEASRIDPELFHNQLNRMHTLKETYKKELPR